ncbi:MAG TPA: hypothetical protein EYO74_04940 [Piscirickettsiaceae bacterium]|jgi:3-hydroxymyristoyl/3-hydroxydecanoyl-(acyl carrier protein) dehydratase|nr:hypothetical protein [Piscirickettsiaceae bacterium]
MISFDFIVSSSHPSIPGHFPGNPIVPGAVIIENVIQAFSRLDDFKKVVSISTVKFIKPIATNQRVDVHFRSISAELIAFECVSDNVASVLGRLKIR